MKTIARCVLNTGKSDRCPVSRRDIKATIDALLRVIISRCKFGSLFKMGYDSSDCADAIRPTFILGLGANENLKTPTLGDKYRFCFTLYDTTQCNNDERDLQTRDREGIIVE